MIATVAVGMTIILFGLGMASCIAGLWIILSREYQDTMRQLSVHSTRISSRAIRDEAIAPVIDAASRLIEAVNQLIRTAVGVGAFLCILGILVCAAAFWLTTQISG